MDLLTSNCTLGPYLWLIWSFLNPTSPKLSFESNIDVIKMIPKFDPKWPLHFLQLWRHNGKKIFKNFQILNLLEIKFHLGHITLVYLNYNKSYELFPKVSILGPLCGAHLYRLRQSCQLPIYYINWTGYVVIWWELIELNKVDLLRTEKWLRDLL